MQFVRGLRGSGRPSPGILIACIALFVSLGGTGYAVTPANSFIVLRAIQTSGGNLDVNNADSPQVHLAATWLAPAPPGGCASV